MSESAEVKHVKRGDKNAEVAITDEQERFLGNVELENLPNFLSRRVESSELGLQSMMLAFYHSFVNAIHIIGTSIAES